MIICFKRLECMLKKHRVTIDDVGYQYPELPTLPSASNTRVPRLNSYPITTYKSGFLRPCEYIHSETTCFVMAI